MKRVAGEIEGSELGIGELDAFGIFIFVKLGAYGKSGCGGRCGDQLNNSFETSQGLAAPVDGNEGKEAVFDLIVSDWEG